MGGKRKSPWWSQASVRRWVRRERRCRSDHTWHERPSGDVTRITMLPDFIEPNFDGSQSARSSHPGDRPDDCHPGVMLPSRAMHACCWRGTINGPVPAGSAASGGGAHQLIAAWSASKAATRSQWSCQSRSMSHAVRSAMARAKSRARPGLQRESRKATRSRRNQSQPQGLRPPQLAALDGDPYARRKGNEFELQRNPESLASTTSMKRGVSLWWLARTGPGWSRVGRVGNRTPGGGATNFLQIAPNSCKRIGNQSTVLRLAAAAPTEIVPPSNPWRPARSSNDQIYVNRDTATSCYKQ